jgi:hypothetical protein
MASNLGAPTSLAPTVVGRDADDDARHIADEDGFPDGFGLRTEQLATCVRIDYSYLRITPHCLRIERGAFGQR